MMTKTEAIVRLLQSSIAGTSSVSLDGKFERMWHQHVLVTIVGVKLLFWMRSELRRIKEAIFPDGSTINTIGFEAEHCPPKGRVS